MSDSNSNYNPLQRSPPPWAAANPLAWAAGNPQAMNDLYRFMMMQQLFSPQSFATTVGPASPYMPAQRDMISDPAGVNIGGAYPPPNYRFLTPAELPTNPRIRGGLKDIALDPYSYVGTAMPPPTGGWFAPNAGPGSYGFTPSAASALLVRSGINYPGGGPQYVQGPADTATDVYYVGR